MKPCEHCGRTHNLPWRCWNRAQTAWRCDHCGRWNQYVTVLKVETPKDAPAEK